MKEDTILIPWSFKVIKSTILKLFIKDYIGFLFTGYYPDEQNKHSLFDK